MIEKTNNDELDRILESLKTKRAEGQRMLENGTVLSKSSFEGNPFPSLEGHIWERVKRSRGEAGKEDLAGWCCEEANAWCKKNPRMKDQDCENLTVTLYWTIIEKGEESGIYFVSPMG